MGTVSGPLARTGPVGTTRAALTLTEPMTAPCTMPCRTPVPTSMPRTMVGAPPR